MNTHLDKNFKFVSKDGRKREEKFTSLAFQDNRNIKIKKEIHDIHLL